MPEQTITSALSGQFILLQREILNCDYFHSMSFQYGMAVKKSALSNSQSAISGSKNGRKQLNTAYTYAISDYK